jgi:uncharacterized protein YecE (DUF72 family)
LTNLRGNLAEFFASGVLELGHKLGPLLWQLSSNLPFEFDEIERLVTLLPKTVDEASALAGTSAASEAKANRRLRHAIEVRHPSFLNTAFLELLAAHRVAVVFTNSPGAPGFRELTSDFVYLRLSSGDDHYADGYDDPSLARWARQLTQWRDGDAPRDVFAHFKNPAGVLTHTPHNSTRLIAQLQNWSATN